MFGVLQERFKVCERENKTKAFSKVQASSAAPFSRLLVYRRRCKLMNTRLPAVLHTLPSMMYRFVTFQNLSEA